MRGAILASAALVLVAATPARADDLRAEVAADMPALMALYRDLHTNPELSFQEFETSAKLAKRMKALGFEVTEHVGKTGVVSVMRNGEGPVVMIRADMDALPVVEQTGLPFASTKRGVSTAGVESGVMHSCGHDTHMAAFVGTAQRLVAHKDKWQGTLVMVLQPAEEMGLGAQAMLDDGLFTRFPMPDYAIAFHNAAAPSPAGTIGTRAGYAFANVDSVDIIVKGVGGHGATPEATKDPIVLASAIVMKLQTLVSRENSPLDPAVVTVGSFHAGAKHNIISDKAELQLTVRSYSDASRKLLLDGIARIARGEAIASGLPDELMPDVAVRENYTPSTYNDEVLTKRLTEGFVTRFGADRVGSMPQSMGGEDFGRYRRAAPDHVQSLIFIVSGTTNSMLAKYKSGEAEIPSLHSPFWAPDAEKVIATAVEALASSAMELMP